MASSQGLVEVDSIEIKVIVDNEVDPISPSNNPAVQYAGLMQGLPLDSLPAGDSRGGAKGEVRMGSICCGAHGLSLMITAKRGDQKHTLLFDTGPEGSTWTRNASRLRVDLAAIEHIHLSHWHRDHSGGMLEAIRAISTASDKSNLLTVNVHPDRPAYRGLLTPSGAVVSLEADPTIQEIESAGLEGSASVVIKQKASAHSLFDGFFLSSGAIPRRTAYEKGIRGGLRFVPSAAAGGDGAWEPDEAIADERLVMCRLKGKGLVVFTGCSHAGIINVCRHAIELDRGDEGGRGRNPLHAVVGGFHLADNQPEKLASSLEDLKALEPKVLMPGHCTGWKFKSMCEQAMPGVIVPSFCGTTYTLE
ncbi:metallo-beta-lactamase superfamily protein [Cryphonectria parasitica EP155]|uniref:Metallo-beta-lactamase superfamily protein n=1 Tax=Cryphonectria parasitica (strain ATCC 38755 / EP155) TaxID=660469 RepID=A0A9P4XY46_CRYP1|nr:metallo-beta-lactamase superfamily protein [Cryphonectria parasitica EP155]KAF3763434.1 metallo-beta-lactamase superfamily protein [Cryphonectria parasitica EP155]